MPDGPPPSAARPQAQATLAEARAVAHPVRLRIIRLCRDRPMTNKELAASLGMPAGTALHHVRTLVATGFLVEQAGRPGARGTTEKPYLATDKSWYLHIDDSPERGTIERAMLQAVAAEVDEAGPGAVIESGRLSFRLAPAARAELEARLEELIREYGSRDDPDGEALAMFVLLHRRGRR